MCYPRWYIITIPNMNESKFWNRSLRSPLFIFQNLPPTLSMSWTIILCSPRKRLLSQIQGNKNWKTTIASISTIHRKWVNKSSNKQVHYYYKIYRNVCFFLKTCITMFKVTTIFPKASDKRKLERTYTCKDNLLLFRKWHFYK